MDNKSEHTKGLTSSTFCSLCSSVISIIRLRAETNNYTKFCCQTASTEITAINLSRRLPVIDWLLCGVSAECGVPVLGGWNPQTLPLGCLQSVSTSADTSSCWGDIMWCQILSRSVTTCSQLSVTLLRCNRSLIRPSAHTLYFTVT